MKYTEAIKELEEILATLNTEEADIDQLAERLERATKLIQFCKEKLRSTETKINTILDKEED